MPTVALLGFTFFTSTVEGGTWYLFLPATVPFVVWAARTRRPLIVCCAASMLVAVPGAFCAEYFAGKSIDLLIGAPPAGGYDIYARALARHQ